MTVGRSHPVRNRRRGIFIFVTGFTALSVVVVGILLWASSYRSSQTFIHIIEQLDTALDDGRVEAADELAQSAVSYVKNHVDALRLIRRAYSIHGRSSSDETADLITNALLQRFPGNQNIRGFRVNFLLENGRTVEAAQHAASLHADEWIPLKIEAFLKARVPLDDYLQNIRLPGIALPIPVDAYSDPEAFLQAWALTRDTRYLVDAALLLAAVGKIQDAFDLLESQISALDQESDLVLHSLLAFDLFGGERAVGLAASYSAVFSYRPELYRRLAEFYRDEGEMPAAAGALETLIATDVGNAADYRNRISAALNLGNTEEAVRTVEEALSRIPGDDALLAAHIAIVRNVDGQEAAWDVFGRYSQTQYSGPLVKTAGLLLESRETGYVSIIPRLWELFHNSQMEPQVARILAWILWNTDDRSGIDDMVHFVDPLTNPWIRQYRALDAVRNNEAARALSEISMIPPRSSLSSYLLAGARVALLAPVEYEGIFSRVAAGPAASAYVQSEVREYSLFLLSWKSILSGDWNAADSWYTELSQSFPGSMYLSRLRYWISQRRTVQ